MLRNSQSRWLGYQVLREEEGPKKRATSGGGYLHSPRYVLFPRTDTPYGITIIMSDFSHRIKIDLRTAFHLQAELAIFTLPLYKALKAIPVSKTLDINKGNSTAPVVVSEMAPGIVLIAAYIIESNKSRTSFCSRDDRRTCASISLPDVASEDLSVRNGYRRSLPVSFISSSLFRSLYHSPPSKR